MVQQTIHARSTGAASATSSNTSIRSVGERGEGTLGRPTPGGADELVRASTTLRASRRGLLARAPLRRRLAAIPRVERHVLGTTGQNENFIRPKERLPSYEEAVGLRARQPTISTSSTLRREHSFVRGRADGGAPHADSHRQVVAAQNIFGIHPHFVNLARASVEATATMAALQLFTVATLTSFAKFFNEPKNCKNDYRPLIYTSSATALFFIPGIILSGKITRNEAKIEEQAMTLRAATVALNQTAMFIAVLAIALNLDDSGEELCVASLMGQMVGPLGLAVPALAALCATLAAGAAALALYGAGYAVYSLPAATRAANDYRKQLFSDMDSVD